MFFIFVSRAVSEGKVIELGDYDYYDYIGKDKPAFVKFYNPTCPHCFAMSDEFWQTSEIFLDKVHFCAIDCIAHRKLCVEKFGIEKYPSVALFLNNSQEPIQFDKSMVVQDFSNFIEEKTHIQGEKLPKWFFEISPSNFDYWKTSKKCAFAVYYSSLFPHHKRFLYEARRAAEIFDEEENVTIGIIRCDKYRDLCNKVRDDGYPVGTRFTNGIEMPFNDMALVNFVVSDINDNCGTHRKLDGTIEDDIGVIPEAEQYVKLFMTGNEEQQKEAMDKIKSIEGAGYYLKVMERIKKDGKEKTKATMEKMEKTMFNKTFSRKNRDTIKKNYNVFRVFFPPPPTPTPTPKPKPTLVPNPIHHDKSEHDHNKRQHNQQYAKKVQQKQTIHHRLPVENDDL